ncbi:hypothetical protein LH935_15000 [Gordonia polyisoprenivorans]|nr:hypothetical protein LH935_15000 [Gordonia polyisoprenivorans]
MLNYPLDYQRAYVARLVVGTDAEHVRRLARELDAAGVDPAVVAAAFD